MSHLIVTLDIKDYQPNTFDYNTFGFLFISDQKNFEEQINVKIIIFIKQYNSRNQIIHKAKYIKKDLKYTIKVTKNDSLVGISDFTIPYHLLLKKVTSFEKLCPITMTDSTKRFLFGNSNVNINLKINIHSSIQYSDKSLDNSKKNVVEHQNLILPKRGNSINKVTQSTKTNSIKSNKNIINNMNHTTSNSNVENPIFSKVKRPLTSIHKKLRNSSASPQQRKNNLKFPSKKTNNKDLSCDKKSNFIDKEENPDNDIKDNSFIDFDIEKEEKKVDKDFTEFIKLFKENYPLSKLDNLTDVNEMVKYTKDIISQLL